ncbi:MAG: CDP-glycerol glycerophosphotransferase family protein [Brevibacterium yomogidense]
MKLLNSLGGTLRSVVASRGVPHSRSASVPLRARLEYLQTGADASIRLELAEDAVARRLWARSSRGDLHELGVFSPAGDGAQAGTRAYEAHLSFDDAEIVGWLRSAAVRTAADDGASLDAPESGERFNLFVEVTAPAWRFGEKRQSIDEVPDTEEIASAPQRGATGLIALGRFAHTAVSGAVPVAVSAEHSALIYPTRFGNFVIATGYLPKPYGRVHIDGARIANGDFRFRGRMYTRHGELDDAVLVLEGRDTGAVLSIPLDYEATPGFAESHRGHRRYDLQGSFPLADLLDEEFLGEDLTRTITARDDLFDVRVVSRSKQAAEEHRARVGRSRYLVRRQVNETTVEREGAAVLVSPYYTFKAKNLSIRVEYFAPEVLHAMQAGPRAMPAMRTDERAGSDGPSSRPVWLIGEQSFKAQDNGLEFFRYMRSHHPEIDAYYVIDTAAPDRENLAGSDHVVDFRSMEHLELMFRAERVLGTHHPEYLYPSRSRIFDRMVDPVKVFLQHGVIAIRRVDPLYGRRVEGFDTDLFLVSSEREKRIIVDDLGYRPEEVAVTGLARFDTLFDGEDTVRPGQVLIMPTWREWLQNESDFLDSQYFRRWTELLHSERFQQMLIRRDAEAVFHLHPNMRMFAEHFSAPHVRIVDQGEESVQRMLKQSAVLVTDYSSVGADFSFLGKSVVYYQFDAGRFLRDGAHIDLDTELPGPRVTTLDPLIARIDEALQRDGSISPDYAPQADRLVAHRDTQNSERIFRIAQQAHHREDSLHERYGELLQSATRVARRRKQYLPVMRRLYGVFNHLPVDEGLIVFEAGLGRQMNDSPRAIYDELLRRGDTRTMVWVYKGNPRLPDSRTRVVKKLSPEYFWYLARAKYWVSNQNLPHYITRRPEGVYLQTWHGTPLKRMFHDLETVHGRDEGYRDRVSNAIAQWSHLLSPSPFATDAFASAFRHDAEVLELGYPRNDSLHADDATQVRARVRERLGIPEGKRAVLYAPTFRDNLPAGNGRFWFRPPFTLEEMADGLGEETVLLVRLHVVIKNRLSVPAEHEGRIVDVTSHSDLNELFLASDALVTDYSSLFFDYAPLGRPIAFFPYDLDEYRDELRGFYLDYPGDLPGPVVTELGELADALRHEEGADPAERRRFVERFAPHEDGHAAERAVDAILVRDDRDADGSLR